jgi:pyridoxal phosphate enzyme (YggS family)
MKQIAENIAVIRAQLPPHVTLVAVSKTKPVQALQEAYSAGQRDFGENYVQELEEKAQLLPKDIRWHFIGHLQSNKVKYIAPFVHLIHAVDSLKLLAEIDKQAAKHQRVIDVLLQVHVAKEETKFGWEAAEMLQSSAQLFGFSHVRIRGLMAMASNTSDEAQLATEFEQVHHLMTDLQAMHPERNAEMTVLSMGMSGDWPLAVAHGSNMIRVGSTIFGVRTAAPI